MNLHTISTIAITHTLAHLVVVRARSHHNTLHIPQQRALRVAKTQSGTRCTVRRDRSPGARAHTHTTSRARARTHLSMLRMNVCATSTTSALTRTPLTTCIAILCAQVFVTITRVSSHVMHIRIMHTRHHAQQRTHHGSSANSVTTKRAGDASIQSSNGARYATTMLVSTHIRTRAQALRAV
jgi:hypothetical protein